MTKPTIEQVDMDLAVLELMPKTEEVIQALQAMLAVKEALRRSAGNPNVSLRDLADGQEHRWPVNRN